jgi:hypothetical protein
MYTRASLGQSLKCVIAGFWGIVVELDLAEYSPKMLCQATLKWVKALLLLFKSYFRSCQEADNPRVAWKFPKDIHGQI